MTLYGLSAERTRTRTVDLTFTPPVAPLDAGGLGTVVLAPGVVTEAGGGAADVVPVAVVIVGTVSVRDRVGWLVPVPTDVLVVRASEELLATEELLAAEGRLEETTLLIATLLLEIWLAVDVFAETLVLDTLIALVVEVFGVGLGEGLGFLAAHWEN